MLLDHAGIQVGHLEAIRLLRAFPHGTAVEDLRRVYHWLTGKALAPISIKGVKRALNRGVPVLAVDTVLSPQDHLVIGDRFLVHDPALLIPGMKQPRSRKTCEELLAASGNEFYAPKAAVR